MEERVVIFLDTKWHVMTVGKPESYDIQDSVKYSKGDRLISFQCGDLVRTLTKDESASKVLPYIVDLECLDRQMSQDKIAITTPRGWRVFKSLREHKIIEADFRVDKSNISVFLEKIITLYLKLMGQSTQEIARFNSIETVINEIIYQRQSKGIGIDHDVIQQKCIQLEDRIYKIKNELQMSYGVYDPENEEQQKEYLDLKDYSFIQSFLYSFKVRRNQDPVCRLYYELLRDNQDLDSLLFMLSHWGKAKRTFPAFFGFGTITSRITLRQPALQNLRKSNRVVLVPDSGYKFLYIDYSQFEAGILACLCDEDILIGKYKIDIYRDLASSVLGDFTKRGEAKIIFYRFIYGDKTLDAKSIKYFDQFPKLKEFQKKTEQDANAIGKVGTVDGNYRICHEGDSPWVLSHVVQATASLIYKKAVIRVRNEVPDAKFLIPMHDGTLYQLNAFRYEEFKKRISEIYIGEFKTMFPKIDPQVNCSESFGDS